MAFETRTPEGEKVEASAVRTYSRVGSLAGWAAAWRVRCILGPAVRSRPATVLDIGTGPAAIPFQLRRFWPKARFVGLDVCPDMLRVASRFRKASQGALALVAADAEALPLAAGSCDAVLSFFALHHMDRAEGVLAEIGRVLRPGGTLLIIDFRRDMPRPLYRIMDGLWRAAFALSPSRDGLARSVASAWHPEEIEAMLRRQNLSRFRVTTTRTELCITTLPKRTVS
jgi:ubiquinone/menaquinone biosynthesis C-methylase UbiE